MKMKKKTAIKIIVFCSTINFLILSPIITLSLDYSFNALKNSFYEETTEIEIENYNGEGDYIIGCIDGESMEPTLQDGQMVYFYQDIEPQYYDIISFSGDDGIYVKRIVGCPGDTIYIPVDDGKVYINGEAEDGFLSELPSYPYYTIEVTLADDEYFVMGDNRMISYDSRYFGPIKRSQIIGVMK